MALANYQDSPALFPAPPMLRIDYPKAISHDRGKGVIANRFIQAGTRLLVESVVFIGSYDTFFLGHQSLAMENAVRQQLVTLGDKELKKVKDLTNNYFMIQPQVGPGAGNWIDTPYSGIVKSNGIPFTPDSRGDRFGPIGVFPIWLSKVNHSCHPNSMQAWNTNLNAITLHTLQDIAEDEEITISYYKEAKLDANLFQRIFSKSCNCNWCFGNHLDAQVKQASDHARNQILAMGQQLAQESSNKNNLNVAKIMDIARRLFALLKKEHLSDWRLAHVYHDCLMATSSANDWVRAQLFGIMAIQAYEFCQGLDCVAVGNVKEVLKECGLGNNVITFTQTRDRKMTEWFHKVQAEGQSAWDWLFMKDIQAKNLSASSEEGMSTATHAVDGTPILVSTLQSPAVRTTPEATNSGIHSLFRTPTPEIRPSYRVPSLVNSVTPSKSAMVNSTPKITKKSVQFELSRVIQQSATCGSIEISPGSSPAQQSAKSGPIEISLVPSLAQQSAESDSIKISPVSSPSTSPASSSWSPRN